MHKIQRIGVKSAAKVLTLVFFVLGSIHSVILGVLSGVGGLGSEGTAQTGLIVTVILFPFVYGLVGLVAGALIAFIYNLVAGRFGGIEIELH